MDHPSPVSFYQLLPIDNLKKAIGCTIEIFVISTLSRQAKISRTSCVIYFLHCCIYQEHREKFAKMDCSHCVCAGFWQKSSMNGGVTVSRLRVVSGNNYTQRRRPPIFGCRRAKFTSQTLLSPDPKNPVSGNICYYSTIQIRPYRLVLQFAYFCKTQES